jgi:CrcB protein
MSVLFVMMGGFLGSVCRYILGEWGQATHAFPLGTLLINMAGCLFIGWFLTFITKRKNVNHTITLFVGTGFTGSFTTFSTFSVETIQLFQKGFLFLALLYVLLSIFLGLGLAYAGYKLAEYQNQARNTV